MDLPVPRGSYSLVNIAQPGRMVFIAGQTASDHEGKVVGVGDARAQTRFVLEKIQRAVEAAGGTINDVVALNVFSTDVKYHRDINETRREVLGSNFPTSTMVQVVALGATGAVARDQRDRGDFLSTREVSSLALVIAAVSLGMTD
jgi:enamine deaminase RidA (YjgF/YER057c/UK114 family)